MELQLNRTYHKGGVNGLLRWGNEVICLTIELPWLGNRPRVSCIPEGRYPLRKRYTPRFGSHFEVVGVTDRKYILFHSANDADKELRGCIAPVLKHTGEGKGAHSRAALDRMKERLYPLLDNGHKLYLTIKNADHE